MKREPPPGHREGLVSAARATQGGAVEVWASEIGVVAVKWTESASPPVPAEQTPLSETERGGQRAESDLAQLAVQQIAEYLAGERREFSVPVDWSGATSFSRLVLEECRRIPYGETLSYGELAAAAGRPRAARAVGQALGRNPVPLLVPCHRVRTGDGGLGGFGLGLEAKRRLLALEGREFS